MWMLVRLCVLGTFVIAGCGGSVERAEPTDQPAEEEEPEATTTTRERRTTTTRERRTTTTPAPLEGSRQQPLPFGATAAVSIGESDPAWLVQVAEFTPDGTDAVLAENPFNEPPADGRQFAIVRIRAEYQGVDEPASLFRDLEFVVVDESNVTYDFDDSCGLVPDELDTFAEVYAGGVIEGNLCWSVQTEHIDSLILGIKGSFQSGAPYFMALS